MKRTIAYLAVVYGCLFLWSCNTSVVETYDPVTGKLIGRSTTKNLDADAFTAGANAVTAIATPKGRVRYEK